jgi:hypothetical protein
MPDGRALVIPEVRAFKQRELTFGLPHRMAIFVLWLSCMLFFYFDLWITAVFTFGFFYVLGRAGMRYDPYAWELLCRLPSYPRVLGP